MTTSTANYILGYNFGDGVLQILATEDLLEYWSGAEYKTVTNIKPKTCFRKRGSDSGFFYSLNQYDNKGEAYTQFKQVVTQFGMARDNPSTVMENNLKLRDDMEKCQTEESLKQLEETVRGLKIHKDKQDVLISKLFKMAAEFEMNYDEINQQLNSVNHKQEIQVMQDLISKSKTDLCIAHERISELELSLEVATSAEIKRRKREISPDMFDDTQ